MTIKSRILLLVGCFALMASAVTGLGLVTIQDYNRILREVSEAHENAYRGEHLNRLVTAAVMESRGVYMSKDTGEAKKYADGVDKNLDKIQKLLAEWQPTLAPGQLPEFDSVKTKADEFVGFRRELARLGRDVSPEAANVQGNNEANRSNRKGFQEKIDVMVAHIHANLEATEAKLAAYKEKRIWQFLLIAVTGILAVLGASLWVAFKQISRPLQHVTQNVVRIAEGAYDTEIPDARGKDEISSLWRSIRTLRDHALEAETLKAHQREEEERIAINMREERLRIAGEFEQSMGELANRFATSSRTVADQARTLSESADDASARTESVNHAAVDAANNVSNVAAATEELSASVGEINNQVSRTSEIAQLAVIEAQKTEAAIQTLNTAANQIGDVINLIQAIAAQTNLLALNATIESARAGDAGKGFAVVASEVKQLAQQTARATDDIRARISEIQSATSTTVGSIDTIVKTIENIGQLTTAIAASVEQQGMATNEIANNTNLAATGTLEVTGHITGLSQAASATGTAAQSLLSLSNDLERRSEDLQAEVFDFVGRLRSA
jgi:methyl-accepting chemotaxis protein